MVAPNDKWHVKWRLHCATCGVAFPRAQRWAYCSKPCELKRQGFVGRSQLRRGQIGREVGATREYLRLAAELEIAPMHEREGIRQRMAMVPLVDEDAIVLPAVTAPGAAAAVTTIKTDSADFWVPILSVEWDRFEGTLRKSRMAAIDLGRRLCEAKAALPHGEFGRLFQDHEQPVAGAMRFTPQWARRLMSIAEHETVANRKHAFALPADLESVYQLSRVPAETLEQAIASGTVRPQMRREEVRRFVAGVGASPGVAPTDERDLEACVRAVRRSVTSFVEGRPGRVGELLERVQAILRDIERRHAGGEHSTTGKGGRA